MNIYKQEQTVSCMVTGSSHELRFFAQPYDILATGFFFTSVEEYQERAARNRSADGRPVEEYEIRVIDASALDYALLEAMHVNQANLASAISACKTYSSDDKFRVVLALEHCGCDFEVGRDDPNQLDVDIYHLESLRELAEEFVEEGIMGEIPEALRFYFDYDALARDLAADYTEAAIGGERLIYRCG